MWVITDYGKLTCDEASRLTQSLSIWMLAGESVEVMSRHGRVEGRHVGQ